MPARPLRPCLEPRCPELVRQGRCPRHGGQRKPWAHATPSRHDRGYGREWDQIRLVVLAEEPLCALCPMPSTTVDHIVPKSQGGTDQRGNLRGLCALCQQRKAGREGNASRQALAGPGRRTYASGVER